MLTDPDKQRKASESGKGFVGAFMLDPEHKFRRIHVTLGFSAPASQHMPAWRAIPTQVKIPLMASSKSTAHA